MTTNKLSLNVLIILSFLLFLGCKQEVEKLNLEAKIESAVASRKIPDTSQQKVPFETPESIIGRGPHITEIFGHMENYIPTVLIEKGNTKTRKLPENISNTLGQEILTSSYFQKETSSVLI